jgi:hypothetical protein
MKNLLIIATLFLSQIFYSQLPVTDVGANYSLGMQLSKAVQQVATMKNQLTMLKKANDYVNKVNSKVTQLNHYKNLINEQSRALKSIQQIKKIGESKKIDVGNLQDNLTKISASVKTAQMLLTKGSQMNDFERIQLLENEMSKSASVNMDLEIEKRRLSF